MKPKVYIETSVVGYLTARPSNDLRAAANQAATVEWWQRARDQFDLLVSEFVLTEAALGDPAAAQRRLAVLDQLPVLAATAEVRELGSALIEAGAIPVKAQIDAYHVAIAAVHGIDYLLTWNCAHLANARVRPRIEGLCRSRGYEPPVICTPTELLEE